MSGIAAARMLGALRHEPTAVRAALDAMLGALEHRGGDGRRLHICDAGGLGQHCRRTTPEDRADIAVVDGQLALVLDGRLDNRDELLARLEAEPDISDGELIVGSYRRWGQQLGTHLIGDFAFCLLDNRRHRLLCLRDQQGIRPLYYSALGGMLCCASEMSALLAIGELPRRPDLDQVALFAGGAYREAGATLYRDVHALPAAHGLVADEHGIHLHRYWSPRPWFRLDGLRDEDYATLLRAEVERATRARLRSLGPVAIELSGGTDSATVTGMAESLRRRLMPDSPPPLLLHVSFPGEPDDETPYSNAVAARWGLTALNVDPLADPELTRPRAIGGKADILYDPRLAFWCTLYRQAAERGARTVLTGEGIDLLMRATGLEPADALARGRLGEVVAGRRAQQSWLALGRAALRPHLPRWLEGPLQALRPSPTDGWLTPRYTRQVRDEEQRQARETERSAYPDLVTRELCAALVGQRHGLTANFDRLFAHLGMDVRHPLWDLRLMELVLAMPHRQRWAPGQSKAKPALRRAMEDLLPEEVLTRMRYGRYARYLHAVLFRQHRAEVWELLRHGRLDEAGIIASGHVLAALDAVAPNRYEARHHDTVLSTVPLIALEIWLREL